MVDFAFFAFAFLEKVMGTDLPVVFCRSVRKV